MRDQFLQGVRLARPVLVYVLPELIDERQECRRLQDLHPASRTHVVDLKDVVLFRLTHEDEQLSDIGGIDLARMDGVRPHTHEFHGLLELPGDGKDPNSQRLRGPRVHGNLVRHAILRPVGPRIVDTALDGHLAPAAIHDIQRDILARRQVPLALRRLECDPRPLRLPPRFNAQCPCLRDRGLCIAGLNGAHVETGPEVEEDL